MLRDDVRTLIESAGRYKQIEDSTLDAMIRANEGLAIIRSVRNKTSVADELFSLLGNVLNSRYRIELP